MQYSRRRVIYNKPAAHQLAASPSPARYDPRLVLLLSLRPPVHSFVLSLSLSGSFSVAFADIRFLYLSLEIGDLELENGEHECIIFIHVNQFRSLDVSGQGNMLLCCLFLANKFIYLSIFKVLNRILVLAHF